MDLPSSQLLLTTKVLCFVQSYLLVKSLFRFYIINYYNYNYNMLVKRSKRSKIPKEEYSDAGHFIQPKYKRIHC
jgi:hypothetical protein